MSAVFRNMARHFAATALAVEFLWDDWRHTDYFYYNTDGDVSPFQPLTDLACRALTVATAEFIAARFHAFSDTIEALEFFDCAWASIAQEGACDYAVLPRDEWSGPIRGPLRAAMLVVNEAMFEAVEDGDYPARCVWILQLGRHVMPKGQISLLEDWFWGCKDRLDTHWCNIPHRGDLFSPDFDKGPLLGPCLFLPGADADPRKAETCLREHMLTLVNSNKWLIDPAMHPTSSGHEH